MSLLNKSFLVLLLEIDNEIKYLYLEYNKEITPIFNDIKFNAKMKIKKTVEIQSKINDLHFFSSDNIKNLISIVKKSLLYKFEKKKSEIKNELVKLTFFKNKKK